MSETFPNFRQSLAASFGLHALFFLIARGLPLFAIAPPVEVEITSPFLGTGPARLAPPKAKVEGARGIPLPAEPDKPPQPPKVVEPPKDWITPTAAVKAVEKPPENPVTPGGVTGGTGISPLIGGIDGHAPYGTPNGTGDGGAALTELPRILNLDEVRASMLKYYPESEKRAGNQGDVQIMLHIGVDGLVSEADIVYAASPAFGEAAQKVAKLMRYSPARNARGPVPAKVGVPIQFRLKDKN